MIKRVHQIVMVIRIIELYKVICRFIVLTLRCNWVKMAASPKHWNPSGPPEGDQGLTEELLKAMEGEVVGETIYSKSWILSQLVKVFESLRSQRAVSPDCSRKDRDESPGYSKSDSEELLQDPDPVELEEHFEDELCQLWDASMNSVSVSHLVVHSLPIAIK